MGRNSTLAGLPAIKAQFPELNAQKVRYFMRLYESPKENGRFRTLAECAEGEGYSAPAMTVILKGAGVEITRGKRPHRLQGSEFRGKLKGRFSRVILTVPKLRDRRLALGLSQKAVGAELGLYGCWISNLENNMLRPTPQRIRAFADALEALDPSKQENTRKTARARCVAFEDTEGVPPRRNARKPRGNSWGSFLEDLEPAEFAALRAALDYRASHWADCKGRKKAAPVAEVNGAAQDAAAAVMGAIEAGYFSPVKRA